MHIDRLAVAAASLLAAALPAQFIQTPFNTSYSWTDLGSVPGLPLNNRGLVFKAGDPNTLLIGAMAGSAAAAAIYEIGVIRDSQGFITGFNGTATVLANAPYIDGGLFYGPGDVLFCTTYPTNTLCQIKPGSASPDKVIPLGQFGILSVSTGNFVPPSFPGAGELKLIDYVPWSCQGFTVSPDGNGTYDLSAANGPVYITGGPEGYLYVPPGSELIPDYERVTVCDYGSGAVALYELDANGNPDPATRAFFMGGLPQFGGACTDPITGDLLFSTWSGTRRVLRVTGFGVCGSFEAYGAGIAGQNGVPTIDGGGCAGRGQVMSIDVGSGRAGAPGLMAFGFAPNSIPFLNGVLLLDVIDASFHVLDGNGEWSATLLLPVNPTFNGLNIYAQSFYLDAAATFGVSATGGLHTLVR